MPPLRVGKARDSLRFEYRSRDFSPPHTHAPSACANCYTDLLRFLPINGQLRVAMGSLLLRQVGSNDGRCAPQEMQDRHLPIARNADQDAATGLGEA